MSHKYLNFGQVLIAVSLERYTMAQTNPDKLSCSLTCMCTQLIVVSKLCAPIWTYDIFIQLLEQ